MAPPRLLLPLAAALLAAGALAGCKSQGPDRAMARFYGDDAARAEVMAAAPTHGQQTATPDQPDQPAEPAQTAARPDPATPLPEVDARPERFQGLAQGALDAELGPPALRRAEGPARVWQYRGRACVLDLVLYPGPDGPTVRHLEARDPIDAAPRDTAACLKDLLQARAGAATG